MEPSYSQRTLTHREPSFTPLRTKLPIQNNNRNHLHSQYPTYSHVDQDTQYNRNLSQGCLQRYHPLREKSNHSRPHDWDHYYNESQNRFNTRPLIQQEYLPKVEIQPAKERTVHPAFQLQANQNNQGKEDRLAQAFISLLDAHQKNQQINEDAQKDEANERSRIKKSVKRKKRVQGGLNTNQKYMKWTDTFSRKTALWDQDFDCIFSKVCENFKNPTITQSQMSVSTSHQRPSSANKSKKKIKIKEGKVVQTARTTFNSPEQKQLKESQFSWNDDSDLKTTASKTKPSSNKKKIRPQDLEDLAKQFSKLLVQESTEQEQPTVVYKGKEIPLSQFVDLCSNHHNKCDQFESEFNTLQ